METLLSNRIRIILIVTASAMMGMMVNCHESAAMDPFSQSLVNEQMASINSWQQDMRIDEVQRKLLRLENTVSNLEVQIDGLTKRISRCEMVVNSIDP